MVSFCVIFLRRAFACKVPGPETRNLPNKESEREKALLGLTALTAPLPFSLPILLNCKYDIESYSIVVEG
jgi:hypothetical protein